VGFEDKPVHTVEERTMLGRYCLGVRAHTVVHGPRHVPILPRPRLSRLGMHQVTGGSGFGPR